MTAVITDLALLAACAVSVWAGYYVSTSNDRKQRRRTTS